MPDETWKCPVCAQAIPVAERVCPTCKVTRPGAEEAVLAPAPGELPLVLRDARFNIPVEADTVWSSGTLVLAEQGLFLLSEKDGKSPAEVLQTPPAVPGRFAALSLYLPVSIVTRIVHDRLAGQFIESQATRLPLRLPTAAWPALDAACDRLKIPRS
jgi:hypothetical protein